jgi:F420H(2)-dependent quinone reductase
VKPLGAVLSARFPDRFPAWHRWIYDTTRGYVGHGWTGFPCLLLTTTGRKSGATRTTVLTYVDLDGEPVVAASNGGSPRPPAWFLNVEANPSITVRRGRHVGEARADVLDPGSGDFSRAWEKLDQLRGGRYTAYQQATDRPIVLVRLRSRA